MKEMLYYLLPLWGLYIITIPLEYSLLMKLLYGTKDVG